MPRGLATLLSFVLIVWVGSIIVSLVTSSASKFIANADVYTQRLAELVDIALKMGNAAAEKMGKEKTSLETIAKEVEGFISNVSVSDVIIQILGEVGEIAEEALYIMLFLAFLLHDTGSHAGQVHEKDKLAAMAEKRVYQYISGKVSISLFVAVSSAAIYWAMGVELWHVFGLLSFWLNFIPNVGMGIACILPMPLIALDPTFSPLAILGSFVGPFAVGTLGKDVLEPLWVGNAVALQPVAVLMAIMLWGTAWGITGAILAVPLTAVLRIYLAGINHPLPRYVAAMLTGEPISSQTGAELL